MHHVREVPEWVYKLAETGIAVLGDDDKTQLQDSFNIDSQHAAEANFMFQ